MRGTTTVRAAMAGAGMLAAWAGSLPAQGALAIRAETIAPGYVVISGYTNGNILAVIGDGGVLLVDAQSARRAPQADSALRTFTDLPVRWVINTHYHPDHIQGNAYWRSRGAEIIAHERVADEARKDTLIAEMGWHRAPADAETLPTRTFQDSLRLQLAAGDVVIRHAPSAHTSGDAIVWFPAANVVHMGDILELEAPPFVDRWAGGHIEGMIRAADGVLAAATDRTRVVPGHGPVTDRAGLQAYRDMLAALRDRMTAQIAAGRTRERLAVGDVISGFSDRLGGERRARQFVEQLYPLLRPRSGGSAPVSAGAFIVRLGADTIAVERFERFPDRLDAVLVRRTGTPVVHEYTVALDAGGRPLRFDDSLSRRAGPTPARGLSATVLFGPDSATITVTRDTATTRRVAAAAPAYPALPESFALFELWLATARDEAPVTLVAPLGGPAGRLTPRRGTGDTVYVPIVGGDFVARVDAAGALLELDGSSTTLKYRVERVPDLYIEQLAASFAVRDSVGRGLGAWLSPRDTVIGTVGSTRVWIDYGRPAKRGREIFAHGVLGDTLWRTGANAATQLEISAPLTLGGATLPAGRYTLWTHFRPDGGAELIVNGQSGQWGTQYDPARDVLRVPLRAVPLEEIVELFTIVLEEEDGSAFLGLRWDRTDLRVPVGGAGEVRREKGEGRSKK